ncbi:N-acetyltransferase [Xylanibacillus composti]|uniref:N-acetyltransferase n=1 Tax=Xylanibacillus composti TaxID=1572762 RepID=A0A8J4M299_9BACL|nr:GNAT family N-acetyltransferase [Xylanibacillus composti]GIQ69630.1 N-acetyltransferase [Xylanibacillus composti]
MEVRYLEYVISDDKSKLQIDQVLGFMARSYWANKRPSTLTRKAIEHSYCLGVYQDEEQVGFARIVTDHATIYYICDVFIHEDHRGRGIGKKLIELIVNADGHDQMMGLLGTADAHELYEQFGFIRDAERFLRKSPQFVIQQ